MAGTVITPSPTAAVIQPRTIILQPIQKAIIDYKSKASTILGCIQIVAGVLIFMLCMTIHWTLHDVSYMPFMLTGPAVNGLIFFCLSGGFAIGAAKKRTTCLIITHMIMAIFASLVAISLLVLSLTFVIIMALEVDYTSDYYSYNNDDGHPNEFEEFGKDDLVDWLSTTTTTPDPFIDDSMPVFKNNFRYQILMIVLHTVIMMLSLLEFIITIWGSSLACRAMCCSKTNVMMYGHVEDGQVNIVRTGDHPMAPISAAGQLPMMQANPLPEKEAFKEDNSQMFAPPPYE